MIARFEGKDGKRRLVEVFAEQELVHHNDTIANKLADISEIKELQEGEQLYFRDKPGKKALFFILYGSLDLSDRGKPITIMETGQAVGEFPIVDPSVNYTVTAVAREQSVVAEVSEEQFHSIAKDYPEIWRNMAKMLVKRLRKNNELRQGPSSTAEIKPGEIKPGDLTIGKLIKDLPVSQVWTIIVAIISALATVATVAYKMGTGAW